VKAVIDDAEGAAGKGGVAGALVFGGDFEHPHPGAVLARRQRRASGGIAGPNDDDVELFAPACFHGLILREASFSRSRITWHRKPSGLPNMPPLFATRICQHPSCSRPKTASSTPSPPQFADLICHGAASSSIMPSGPAPAV